MELEWVVSREGHKESTGEVGGERVPVVVKEEAVVAKGGHGHTHLSQVVQVLQGRHLTRG